MSTRTTQYTDDIFSLPAVAPTADICQRTNLLTRHPPHPAHPDIDTPLDPSFNVDHAHRAPFLPFPLSISYSFFRYFPLSLHAFTFLKTFLVILEKRMNINANITLASDDNHPTRNGSCTAMNTEDIRVPTDRLRLAVAITALRHKPPTQPIPEYIESLKARFPVHVASQVNGGDVESTVPVPQGPNACNEQTQAKETDADRSPEEGVDRDAGASSLSSQLTSLRAQLALAREEHDIERTKRLVVDAELSQMRAQLQLQQRQREGEHARPATETDSVFIVSTGTHEGAKGKKKRKADGDDTDTGVTHKQKQKQKAKSVNDATEIHLKFPLSSIERYTLTPADGDAERMVLTFGETQGGTSGGGMLEALVTFKRLTDVLIDTDTDTPTTAHEGSNTTELRGALTRTIIRVLKLATLDLGVGDISREDIIRTTEIVYRVLIVGLPLLSPSSPPSYSSDSSEGTGIGEIALVVLERVLIPIISSLTRLTERWVEGLLGGGSGNGGGKGKRNHKEVEDVRKEMMCLFQNAWSALGDAANGVVTRRVWKATLEEMNELYAAASGKSLPKLVQKESVWYLIAILHLTTTTVARTGSTGQSNSDMRRDDGDLGTEMSPLHVITTWTMGPIPEQLLFGALERYIN